MSSPVEKITVVSSDGDEFKITVAAAVQSEQLKQMPTDDSISIDKVRMEKVSTEILVKVIEYCQKHADHEAVAKANGSGASDSKAEELNKWGAEFMKVDVEDRLFHSLMAANYLEIKGLFDLACQTVADLIKGKTLKQIRKIFNLKNDFTPEEEERLRRQHNCSFD
ncbi:SKP1-like protein 1B [Neltuma alba]|uniref:SKP1-like protein 1B n=1 Tax=Neltuma alba TaxID=207710 RepID=UPI0010A43DC7|nr:SKP1-like protein 1B [Prosopis alba]